MSHFAYDKFLGKSSFREEANYSPASYGGLIAWWKFSEGTGNTVADETGTYPIDLTLAATPNFTWTAQGGHTSSGLIQTPTITNARTVVVAYRVPAAMEGAFQLSGGQSSGAGVYGSQISSGYLGHAVLGGGIPFVPFKRNDTGGAQYVVNAGGWILLFVEFTQQFTNPMGFGGRYGTTTSRCPTFDIGVAMVYDRTLTDSERVGITSYVRREMKARGAYFVVDDCPTIVDVVKLFGQSNAEGRALISELSSTNAARANPCVNTWISDIQSSGVYQALPPAQVSLGTNNTLYQYPSAITTFGPEMGIAWAREDAIAENRLARDLYICKTAQGSTWMVASSTGVTASSLTWNSSEIVTSGLDYIGLTYWYRFISSLMNDGYGPDLKLIAMSQGEQDATNLTAGADYLDNLRAFWNSEKNYLGGYKNVKFVIARTGNTDPGALPIAVSDVRTAQETLASERYDVVIFNADDLTVHTSDYVHFDGSDTGQPLLGSRFHNAYWGI